jgi:hypothetical protein
MHTIKSFFIILFFVTKAFISQVNTNNEHFVNYTQQRCYIFPKNTAGFEPGSSIPEANAMSTAPRRARATHNKKLSVNPNF